MAEQRRMVDARDMIPGLLVDLVSLSAGWKETYTPRDLLKAGLMVLMRPKEGYLAVSWALQCCPTHNSPPM